MSLLAEVAAILRGRGTSFAVIGAAALATHGVSRATADLDLLVVDDSCLDENVWRARVPRGVTVDVRRGDASDPLAGVIRLHGGGPEGSVDVIVGRHAWQTALLTRAEPREIGSVRLPVARAADLVLLKLYAGGPQDAWDIDRLLDRHPSVVAEVESRLAELSADCVPLWRRILADRAGRE